MSFIEVKSGAPTAPQNWQDGTYVLRLASIGDPKTVLATKGQMAGQEVDLIDWTFVIDDTASPFHGLEVRRSTSTASGPKSTMYGILTALLGGRVPAVGQRFDKADLVERRVLGALALEESGYIRVNALTALPAAMLGQQFAAATGTPTRGTPPPAKTNGAPLNLQPAEAPTQPTAADDLPF